MAKKAKGTMRDVGERGLIEWVRRYMPGNASGLIKGVGDDAAVLIGGEIITSDMLVENVHFDLKWQSPVRLGRKALAVNLSDIAGMGGLARCAFVNVAIPPTMKWKVVEDILKGFSQSARDHGVAVAGGDTTASPRHLVISVTVVGNTTRPVMRSTARPGDIIYVTGTLGDASLALRMLTSRSQNKTTGGRNMAVLASRLTDPKPRIKQGNIVGRYASAMIDVSDGLSADLGHICRESNVGARINLDAIPLSDSYLFVKGRIREKTGKKLYSEALSGGEDYELLFTVQESVAENIPPSIDHVPITRLGVITEASEGMVLVDDDKEFPINPNHGYTHF